VIRSLHTFAILVFVAALKLSTVHNTAAAFPSVLSTYWGFIFSAYVRKGDEGYGQIESCGEVDEDLPTTPQGLLLLLLLSSGVTTGLAIQMVNLICSSVVKFGLQVGYRFYESNYKFIIIH